MPGCTVPNCTNSSQKGFKLYRFPSDKERNLIWVTNCGRERGWKPTKHTSVCEVHFDESQFESHRADGLRKLKPNAIPTIFARVPYMSHIQKPKNNENIHISSRDDRFASVSENHVIETKQKIEVNSEYSDEIITKEADHTYPKFLMMGGKDESPTTEEVFINVSFASKCDEIKKTSGKERTFQRIKSLEKKEETDEWVLKSCQNKKRGRPPDSVKSSASRKMMKISIRDKEEMKIEEAIEDISSSTSKCIKTINIEEKQCFVCGKVVDKGLSLFTLTNTTKVCMYQKLDKIVTGEMDLLLKEEGILCSRCANLLNYMDRIEVELNMLKKAILNCIRKQFGMKFKSDNSQENLIPTVEETEIEDKQNSSLEMKSRTEFDLQSTHKENYENCASNAVNSYQNVNESSVESTSLKQIQCQICKFKSTYKSVMIFHLRQHLKDEYWCDFCNASLPDDALNWIEKGNSPVLHHNATGEEEKELLTEKEKEIDSSNNISVISDSQEVLIKIVPVSDDVMTSNIVEAVACRNHSTDASYITKHSNTQCSENLCPRKSTKQIRVLNELGNIVIQEIPIVPISNDSEEIKKTDEDASQECTFSQLSFQTKPVELQLLGETTVSELSGEKAETSRSRERLVINEMGMIFFTGEEERQLFQNSDMESEPKEVKVNLTPNLLTYSNENISLKDNETNYSMFGR